MHALRLPALALALALASPAAAAPVLDASYPGTGGTARLPDGSATVRGRALPAPDSLALATFQTFTPLTSGLLTGIGFHFATVVPGSSLLVVLTTTAAGSPAGGATLLSFATTTPANAAVGFIDFNVSAGGVRVSAGTTYALGLAGGPAAGSTQFVAATGFDSSGAYASGQYYTRVGLNFSLNPGQDMLFRTFVDAVPVPEPSALALVASALLGIAALRRR